MVSRVGNSEKTASLRDCSEAIVQLCAVQNEQNADLAGKRLENISKVTRQFEKVFLVATVAGASLSLNLFIGSVSLLCSSGVCFIVPLALSVGTTLITVDLITLKVLTERIRKVARQLQDFYSPRPQPNTELLLTDKFLKGIKKIHYEFNDLLVLPNISGTELYSFKQIVSFFLLKQVNKLALAQDVLAENDIEVQEKAADMNAADICS